MLDLRGVVPAAAPAARGLVLSESGLETVPDWVPRLRQLEMLDPAHNRLAAVPDVLADAPALEKLDLRWNDLRALPPAAKRLADRGCFVLW